MSDDRPPEPGPDARPKRKKRSRREDAAPADVAPADAPPAAVAPEEIEAALIAVAAAREKDGPAFARDWPEDEALSTLVAAFEAGDYARVRREAPALARRTESDDVRRAARELARRLDPEPAAVYMLAVAAMLLVFLAGWYWTHPHLP